MFGFGLLNPVYSEFAKTGYPDQIREIQKRSEYRPNRFGPVFEFDIPYFVLIPNLSKNTKTGRSNVKIGTERNGIYPDRFQP